MCLICIELVKQTMTTKEVARALNEFSPKDEEHWEEISKILKDKYNEQDVIEEFWNVYKEKL